MELLSAISFVDVDKLATATDPVKKIIASIFSTQYIDPDQVHALLTPLKDKRIDDRASYRKSLQTLLCVAIFADMSESVKDEVLETAQRFFFKLRQTHFEEPSLERLIATLLGVEIELSQAHIEWDLISETSEQAIYEAFSAYLNKKDLTFYLNYVDECLPFFDQHTLPFFGFQQKERDFCRTDLLALYALLFFLAHRFGGGDEIEKRSLALIAYINKEPFEKVPAHLILIYLYFDLLYEGSSTSYESEISLPYFNKGTLVGADGPFHYIFTSRGKGTGLGAIHKKYLKILSFGPQFPPIGSMENFGIWNPSSEASFEIDGDKKKFFGWTKLIRPGEEEPSPSLSWIYHDYEISEAGIQIKIEFNAQSDQLLLALFVQAEMAQVEQRTLRPLSLDRYYGAARQMIFTAKDEQLTLKSRTHFHLIPLAGEDHFWSANFLVVFEASTTDNLIKIEIS